MMAIDLLSIILLAILNLLPNSATQFTVQRPEGDKIMFEKRNDGFWYAPKAQGGLYEGIQLKEGNLVSKTGETIVNEGDIQINNKPIKWKEVELISEGNSFIKVVRKAKGCEIVMGSTEENGKQSQQVFKTKWK